jgi:hypothetical protein
MPSLIPDVAAFKRRLAGLPVVKHRPHEVVLTAGSKTGRLLFLKSGAVEVIKDGVQIANVSARVQAQADVNSNQPGGSRWRRRRLLR